MIHDDSQDFCEDSLRPMRTTQQVQFRCLSDEPGAAARSYGRSHDLCREKLFDSRVSSTAVCHQQQRLQGGESWGLIGSMI